ncbi:phage tail length tape measure protein [Brevundimonas sp. GN22]|uniref:phage tail tape measure C-terminal domain-containing protein n=1 Tax=Brevundimonas pishanensis TaxID=2896315 RepID=UPI001FA8134C|nr:phage tail tape measure C-terminal domain-containing protein [Brevundimonas pishanensis]
MADEFDGLGVATAEAAAALEGLKEPAQKAAGAIEEAFSKAGGSLSRSLMRAAKDGEVSMAELARAVIGAINASAGVLAKNGGLGEALSAAVGGVFSGARADGGAVAAGGAYLVGERGPEVFRPGVGGSVEPMRGASPVVVNVMVDGGPQALLRSEAQVARMMARAAALGMR